MNMIHKIKPAYAIAFLLIIYLVGVAGLSTGDYQQLVLSLTPVNLLVSAMVLFLYHKKWKSRHLAAFLIVLAGGFLIEVIGVKSGMIFGNYQYGGTLGPKLLETPLLIGLNWLMLIYMVFALTRWGNMKFVPQVVTAAFLMLAYDLMLEPVAIQLDFWNWGGQGIPVQNYLAWWIISAVFVSIWRWMKIHIENSVAAGLFIIQFAFFLILNFTL